MLAAAWPLTNASQARRLIKDLEKTHTLGLRSKLNDNGADQTCIPTLYVTIDSLNGNSGSKRTHDKQIMAQGGDIILKPLSQVILFRSCRKQSMHVGSILSGIAASPWSTKQIP